MVKENKIVEGTKKMGNGVFGGVPRGIHMCQFYQTKEDLIDVLVPYFKAGLENNEFCMWIAGELLLRDEIIRTMTRNLFQFEHFLITGQIEIIPYTKWFLTDDVFDQHRVLDAWMDKLEQALDKGYDGMRVTGDFAPLIEGNWTNLMDYEMKVNDSIGENRITGICTYPLVKCAASEVLDMIHTHQFVLTKRAGRWESLEISLGETSKNDTQPLPDTTDRCSCSYTVDADKGSALDGISVQPCSNSKAIVISGHKSCTRDNVSQKDLDCFYIDLELDPVDFEIIDFACTNTACVGEEILRDALLGQKAEEGVKNAIEQVRKRLPCSCKSRIIIGALKEVHRWYKKMKTQKENYFSRNI